MSVRRFCFVMSHKSTVSKLSSYFHLEKTGFYCSHYYFLLFHLFLIHTKYYSPPHPCCPLEIILFDSFMPASRRAAGGIRECHNVNEIIKFRPKRVSLWSAPEILSVFFSFKCGRWWLIQHNTVMPKVWQLNFTAPSSESWRWVIEGY